MRNKNIFKFPGLQKRERGVKKYDSSTLKKTQRVVKYFIMMKIISRNN